MSLKDPVKRKKYHDTYSKKWYEERKEEHKELQKVTRVVRIRRNYEYVSTLKKEPCTDCSKKYPSYVMQFDHLPEYQKVAGISQMKCWSLEKIQAELKKCELVCANCHAERTYLRRKAALA